MQTVGVDMTMDVLDGCPASSDLQEQIQTEDTGGGHTLCADATGRQVDGMVMPCGKSTTENVNGLHKVRTSIGHTDIRQPSHSLTRAGIPAKPPEEPITAKPVVVRPTKVSQNTEVLPTPSFSPAAQQLSPDGNGPREESAHRGQVDPSHRLIDTVNRSRRDVKGKYPKSGTALPAVTKGTPDSPPTCQQIIDRHSGQLLVDHHQPTIRCKLNNMFHKISIFLNKLKEITK